MHSSSMSTAGISDAESQTRIDLAAAYGLALRDEEKPRLIADLAEETFLMLRNHGLLTVGRTIADAFAAMRLFEATCSIQIRAQAGGGRLLKIGAAILENAPDQVRIVTRGRALAP